jgi:uncharacterized membrane protein
MSSIHSDPATGTWFGSNKPAMQRRQRQDQSAPGFGATTSLPTRRGKADEIARINVEPIQVHPAVRVIAIKDLRLALAKGFDDFKAKPTHMVFLSIIYPVAEFMLARYMLELKVLPLVFPLVAGFALIGPFAAIGLYELSRRREQSDEASWWHALGVLRLPTIRAIVTLGTVLAATFSAWLAAAMAVYKVTFGSITPTSVTQFVHLIFATPSGWALIVLGNGIGLLFAVLVFTLSVVSFPLLLEHNVSIDVAIQTSVSAVLKNPKVMAIWGLTVVCGLVIGTLTFFAGLAVVIPVLAHSTWHLYRRVVTP